MKFHRFIISVAFCAMSAYGIYSFSKAESLPNFDDRQIPQEFSLERADSLVVHYSETLEIDADDKAIPAMRRFWTTNLFSEAASYTHAWLVSDGDRLRVLIRSEDPETYGELEENHINIVNNDGIEFFIAEADSMAYTQIIYTEENEIFVSKYSDIRKKIDSNFKEGSVDIEFFEESDNVVWYDILFDLRKLGFEADRFKVNMARNYRGQHLEKSLPVSLFPSVLNISRQDFHNVEEWKSFNLNSMEK